MPALTNPRHERFCQLLKRGIPPYRAYPMAGYNAHNGAPYRLCEHVRIKRRLSELTRHIAVKTRVTVETLTDEFNEAIAIARETRNAGAVTQAAIAKGKLHGLIIERKEAGAPGDFAGLQSAEEVLALVKTELGDETAALLAKALGKQEEQPAAVVDEVARDEGSTLQ
jgi:hypothetical protein